MDMLLWILWGLVYLLCFGLGFLPNAAGFGKAVLILNSLVFFLPGALLLSRGIKTGNRRQVRRVRLACILSLALTTLAFIANVFSAYGSEALGKAMHILLMAVSVPMFCSQYRIIGVFLWACLLVASFNTKNKK